MSDVGQPLLEVQTGPFFSKEELTTVQKLSLGPTWNESTGLDNGNTTDFGSYHILLDFDEHRWIYAKLESLFVDTFHEPLVMGEGLELDVYSIRWGSHWLGSDRYGFIHDDCEDMQLCTQYLPPELAHPELSGWKWDTSVGTAMVIPLRVPSAPSGKAHSLLFSETSRGDSLPSKEAMKEVSSEAGSYVFFNMFRHHTQRGPLHEDDVQAVHEDPRRDHLIGFALRQVPEDSQGERGAGRWVLGRMCKGTSNPAVKEVLPCSFCRQSECSNCH